MRVENIVKRLPRLGSPRVQIVALLVATLVPIWLSSYLMLLQSRDGYLRETQHEVMFRSQAFAENAKSNIKRIDDILSLLRKVWVEDPDGFLRSTRSAQANAADLTFHVAVIDASGYLVASTQAYKTERIYLGDEEHFRVHEFANERIDRLAIGEPVKSRTSGRWMLQFTRPIFDKGLFRGVIVASVAPDTFSVIFERSFIENGGEALILNDNGEILSTKPVNEALYGTHDPRFEEIAGRPLLNDHLPDNAVRGDDRISGYQKSPEYGLTFIASRRVESALASHEQHRTMILGNAVAISGFVIGIIVLLYLSWKTQRQHLLEMRRQKDILRSSIESIDEAFAIFDRDDRLLYCNAKYLESLAVSAEQFERGISYEEIVKQAAAKGVFSFGRSDDIEQWIANTLDNHRRSRTERVIQCGEGRWIKVRERVTPDGLKVGFRVDITDLVTAQRLAEQASVAKSEFLTNMSHEIRTPINAVMGFAQLCEKTDLPPQGRDYVRKIAEASESLLDIINDILDLSKIDAGKLEIESLPFRMSDELRKVSRLFATKAGEKGIGLSMTVHPGVPATLIGDPLRIRQILVNLIGNALKFTHRGRVDLNVSASAATDDEVRLSIEVCDTGIGMRRDELATLFTPFTQGDASITRRYGGTGLGLTISRKLAVRMGGTLSANSAPGVGSTFVFDLPLRHPLPDASRTTAEVPPAGTRVMVVGPSTAASERSIQLLSAMGCIVEPHEGPALPPPPLEYDAVLISETALAALLEHATTPTMILGADATVLLLDGEGILRAPFVHGELQFIVSRSCLDETLGSTLAAALGRRAAPAQRSTGISVPDFHGRQILVVDDNEFNREVAGELLKVTGAAVDTVNSGQDAIAPGKAEAFDLILMDLQMPEMDGYAATRLIQARGVETPIVALTAHAMNDARDSVLAAGMVDIITKPIMTAQLYETVGKWLGSGRHRGTRDTSTTAAPQQPVVTTPPAPETVSDEFDETAALERVNGDRALLDSFLDMFRRHNASLVSDLKRAIAGNETEAARRIAHTLKGGAGTIGMMSLHRVATELERALSDVIAGNATIDDCTQQIGALDQAWQRCQQLIARRLDDAASGLAPMSDTTESK